MTNGPLLSFPRNNASDAFARDYPNRFVTLRRRE
jgi:hypothetical protein